MTEFDRLFRDIANGGAMERERKAGQIGQRPSWDEDLFLRNRYSSAQWRDPWHRQSARRWARQCAHEK